MASADWTVEFHPDFESWATGLAQSDKEALLAAIHVLQSERSLEAKPGKGPATSRGTKQRKGRNRS